MSRVLRGILAIASSLALASSVAHARKDGIAGESGQGAGTCNDCHSGGPAPTVKLTGPTMLQSGATGSYELVITGGAAKVGGLGVSVDDPGALFHPRSDTTRAVGGTQLVHDTPVPFTDGALHFPFDLTAPAHATRLTIYAAGNSCNGDGQKTGDQAAMTALSVVVEGAVGSGGAPDEPVQGMPQTGCSYSGTSAPVAAAPVLLSALLIWSTRRRRSATSLS